LVAAMSLLGARIVVVNFFVMPTPRIKKRKIYYKNLLILRKIN